MKKSEKVKGKEAAALRKKKYTQYGIGLAAGIIVVVAVIGFIMLNPATAKTGDTVSVYYTGTLDNGAKFDSNVNGTPLQFVIGKHSVIPGFEDAVIGMALNSEKTVHIPVDKAYGPYRSDLVSVVNRSEFSPGQELIVGQQYQITNPASGAVSLIKILNVTSSTVTIDQNEALAGQNLTFFIKLVRIVPV